MELSVKQSYHYPPEVYHLPITVLRFYHNNLKWIYAFE